MPQDTKPVELPVETVMDIIDDVEDQILSEDKHGASRNQVAEGTCSRIRRRINEHERVPE